MYLFGTEDLKTSSLNILLGKLKTETTYLKHTTTLFLTQPHPMLNNANQTVHFIQAYYAFLSHIVGVVKENVSIPYPPQSLIHISNHVIPQVQNILDSSLLSNS